MATRIYCDNCGNTVTTPIRFCFGPRSAIDAEVNDVISRYLGTTPGVGGFQAALAQQNSNQAPLKTVTIDLCQICVPIWMTRVANLTKASEPE